MHAQRGVRSNALYVERGAGVNSNAEWLWETFDQTGEQIFFSDLDHPIKSSLKMWFDWEISIQNYYDLFTQNLNHSFISRNIYKKKNSPILRGPKKTCTISAMVEFSINFMKTNVISLKMRSKSCNFISFVIDMIDKEMSGNLNHFTYHKKWLITQKNHSFWMWLWLRVKDHDWFPPSGSRLRFFFTCSDLHSCQV